VFRYLLLSTAIVLSVATSVAGWVYRDLIRIKIASVYANVPPKPAAPSVIGTANPVPLSGDAPWALSALPECLIQTSESTGPREYVLDRLPPGSQAVTPPATLTYGDCTIFLAGDEATVERGRDRFRIPPPIRLYRSGTTLALLRLGPGGMELRVYQPPSR